MIINIHVGRSLYLLANLEILISPASGVHALDEGDVVGLVEDEGAIWAHRAVSGHHLRRSGNMHL